MAELSISGLDDLMLSLEEIIDIPTDVTDEMLNAGADVIVEAQKKAAEDMHVEDTGLMIDSISKSDVKLQDKKHVIYVYPKGTRVRKDKTGGITRVRNAEIAFVNEFGARGKKPRPFVRVGNETAAEDAVQAQAEVYNKWLESKNL